jgi:hypothetical protein
MPNVYPIILFRLMDPPREKCSKVGHDDVRTSKRGHKSVVSRPPPPQDSPPSDHNDDEEPETLQMHEPEESGSHVFIKYSKKMALRTLTENREASIYAGQRMCTD